MQPYVLALDQGTTSSRAILFDRRGRIKAMAQREFGQHFPQPGWVEHDANEIWETQLSVARDVMRQLGISAGEIAAIGITNQRETTVLWDRVSGQPIAPAIVWQDRRTAGMCDRLRTEGHAALIQQKTGLMLDAYFSGTKVRWLLDSIPLARERALRGEIAFGTIDSWLIYNLCGAHVTDSSNASRTLLFNIHTLGWDSELLDLFDVPSQLMPQLIPSCGLVGKTFPALLGGSVPVGGVAGDQQAATFGQGCLRSGMAKNTYGTGCFMLMNAGSQVIQSRNNLLSTVGWSLGSVTPAATNYLLEGSVFMAGAIVQWLRDGLNFIHDTSEFEPLAASVSDAGGTYLVPAFTGLGAPYWDAYARGTLLGMTRGTSKAHISRAALDSIAYQTSDILEAMQMDSGIKLAELRVDGGASRNNLLLQFQADILGVPVVRPTVTETSALGAAYLAGLAVNFWSSIDELASHWEIDRTFLPAITEDERSRLIGGWRRAVERARAWAE